MKQRKSGATQFELDVKKRIAAALQLEAEKLGIEIGTNSYHKKSKSRAFKGLRLKDAA